MPSKANLAKIHIAKKELALTEVTYRDILQLNFQVTSAKQLSEPQARELIRIFKAKGWQPQPLAQPRQQQHPSASPFIAIKPGPAAKQQRKVLALWHELGYSMDKIHARVKKQFNIDRFEWLEDHQALHILITDLERRLNRQQREKQ